MLLPSMSGGAHAGAALESGLHVIVDDLRPVDPRSAELLGPGDAAGFKAGDPNGHCFQNRSDRDVVLLEIGTRVPDYAKLYFAGHLSRSARNAEGLASIVAGFFGLPARVEQFTLAWLDLPRDQQTALGGAARSGSTLGDGLVLGQRVRDAQSRFRISIGPMDLDRYHDFLPGGRSIEKLVDWVRNWVGFEFDWEVQLVLARDEVPGIRLGREGQLGWTSWLGARRAPTDADDLVLAPERTPRHREAA